MAKKPDLHLESSSAPSGSGRRRDRRRRRPERRRTKGGRAEDGPEAEAAGEEADGVEAGWRRMRCGGGAAGGGPSGVESAAGVWIYGGAASESCGGTVAESGRGMKWQLGVLRAAAVLHQLHLVM